jgi:hypothetical protein
VRAALEEELERVNASKTFDERKAATFAPPPQFAASLSASAAVTAK